MWNLKVINQSIYMDKSDVVLNRLVKEIRIMEITLFKISPIVNGAPWIIYLKDGKACPQYGGNNRISLEVDFIKKIYVKVFFCMTFYASKIQGVNLSQIHSIVKIINEGKKEFFNSCFDERYWKNVIGNQYTQNAMIVDWVFLSVIHYFICHEIGHSLNPGNGPIIEKKCDDFATKALLDVANRAAKVGYQYFELNALIGSCLAQIVISAIVKGMPMGDYDENELKILSDRIYPVSYDRMLHFINTFNGAVRNLHCQNFLYLKQNVIDDCFGYFFMGLIFLYRSFDYTDLLNYNISFKEISQQHLQLLTIFSQDELESFIHRNHFCRDEYIGDVVWKNNKWTFSRRNNFNDIFTPAEIQKGKGTWLFILESPHKKEFFKHGVNVFGNPKDVFVNSRPANGSTKRRFDQYIDEVLANLGIPNDRKSHPIVIVNACRFQCSLGAQIKGSSLRDDNFKKLFESQVSWFNKDSLIDRILSMNPSLIVNACTKGNNPNYELRVEVDNLLYSHKISFIKAYHPSSWHSKYNRQRRP